MRLGVAYQVIDRPNICSSKPIPMLTTMAEPHDRSSTPSVATTRLKDGFPAYEKRERMTEGRRGREGGRGGREGGEGGREGGEGGREGGREGIMDTRTKKWRIMIMLNM